MQRYLLPFARHGDIPVALPCDTRFLETAAFLAYVHPLSAEEFQLHATRLAARPDAHIIVSVGLQVHPQQLVCTDASLSGRVLGWAEWEHQRL